MLSMLHVQFTYFIYWH